MAMTYKHILPVLVLGLGLILGACGTSPDPDPQGGPVSVPVHTNPTDISSHYDCLVLGGEPEGVAAGLAAARNGAKTLLICEEEDLGGLYTMGMLNFIDVPETRSGQVLVKGVYGNFFEAVGGSGFDIDHAKAVFYDMVQKQEGLTYLNKTSLVSPLMEGDALKGLTVDQDGEEKTYTADVLIDATTDADLAAAAGAPYTFAGEDIGQADRHMGVTLVFGLRGVDWGKVTTHVTAQRAKGEATGGPIDMGAKGNTAWGYTREGYAYEPKDPAMRLRGLNIARQYDGEVLINALIIFDVDVLDKASLAKGIARGQAELEHIVPYMQETMAGFEKAELSRVGQSLYVRESRHIQCEQMLTIDDVMENRDQWDKVAVSNYPVDVQPTKEQTYGTVIGFPDQYAISYKSLVPLKVDNLLVVGRAAGYHSMPAGSARIVPTGMACAEGAGTAAALAVDLGKAPRDLCDDRKVMAEMKKRLVDQGANLDHAQTHEPVMDHWAYDGLKTIRSLGMCDGGYDNNYRLEEPTSHNRYQNLANFIFKKAGFPQDPLIVVNENPPNRQIIGTMTRSLAKIEGDQLPDDYQAYMAYLSDRGVMTADLAAYYEDQEANPDQAQVVQLTANLYRYLMTLPGAVKLPAVSL